MVDIEKIKDSEREILGYFAQFCEKNNLKYSLAYGTLLGAIRHKGFIPWDDDIDVMMPRDDYEKFFDVWKNSDNNGYILEEARLNEQYTNSFAKLFKKNTTLLSENYENGILTDYGGICIDIFPMDKVPSSFVSRKIQFTAALINLLYLRRYTSGKGGLFNIVERLLLKTKESNYIKRRNKANKILQRWNKIDKKLQFVNASTFRESKIYYCADTFDNLEKAEFDGKEYYITSEWDSFLSTIYGNYMELPPENKRVWRHKPVFVDFEHGYDELVSKGLIKPTKDVKEIR